MQSTLEDGRKTVVPISRKYQRLVEAEELLIERLRLDKSNVLSDEEYVSRTMALQIREAAWGQRWGVK
ncbi:MAG: hypothetical protein OIF55_19205 [Amphritea sp.]|nr:hypothetical protein [Amphritea sp.]